MLFLTLLTAIITVPTMMSTNIMAMNPLTQQIDADFNKKYTNDLGAYDINAGQGQLVAAAGGTKLGATVDVTGLITAGKNYLSKDGTIPQTFTVAKDPFSLKSTEFKDLQSFKDFNDTLKNQIMVNKKQSSIVIPLAEKLAAGDPLFLLIEDTNNPKSGVVVTIEGTKAYEISDANFGTSSNNKAGMTKDISILTEWNDNNGNTIKLITNSYTDNTKNFLDSTNVNNQLNNVTVESFIGGLNKGALKTALSLKPLIATNFGILNNDFILNSKLYALFSSLTKAAAQPAPVAAPVQQQTMDDLVKAHPLYTNQAQQFIALKNEHRTQETEIRVLTEQINLIKEALETIKEKVSAGGIVNKAVFDGILTSFDLNELLWIQPFKPIHLNDLRDNQEYIKVIMKQGGFQELLERDDLMNHYSVKEDFLNSMPLGIYELNESLAHSLFYSKNGNIQISDAVIFSKQQLEEEIKEEKKN